MKTWGHTPQEIPSVKQLFPRVSSEQTSPIATILPKCFAECTNTHEELDSNKRKPISDFYNLDPSLAEAQRVNFTSVRLVKSKRQRLQVPISLIH